MIDFTKLNTIDLLKEYKRLKIFPKNNSINTLKNINNNIPTTDGNIVKEIKKLGLVDGIITEQNKIDYLNICLNYSMQSLIKGLMYFSFAESVGDDIENCKSLKIHNLYYGHFFLSYSILQFHGITFKKATDGTNKIGINYIDIKTNELIYKKSSFNSLNHKEFWKIFYKIVESSKLAPDNFILDKIPGCDLSYFRSNNFMINANESTCRNFYTYNYNSFYSTIRVGRSFKIIDTLKDPTENQGLDYTKIFNTLNYEIVYLLGLFNYLSYKSDIKNELFPFLNTGGLKKYKGNIINDIEDFKFEISSVI